MSRRRPNQRPGRYHKAYERAVKHADAASAAVREGAPREAMSAYAFAIFEAGQAAGHARHASQRQQATRLWTDLAEQLHTALDMICPRRGFRVTPALASAVYRGVPGESRIPNLKRRLL